MDRCNIIRKIRSRTPHSPIIELHTVKTAENCFSNSQIFHYPSKLSVAGSLLTSIKSCYGSYMYSSWSYFFPTLFNSKAAKLLADPISFTMASPHIRLHPVFPYLFFSMLVSLQLVPSIVPALHRISLVFTY